MQVVCSFDGSEVVKICATLICEVDGGEPKSVKVQAISAPLAYVIDKFYINFGKQVNNFS